MLSHKQYRARLISLAPKSGRARRMLARLHAAAAAAEHARRAEAARLSDDYEAARTAPFKPDGPPPSGRRRAVLDVGADDHECALSDDDEPAELFDAGEDR